MSGFNGAIKAHDEPLEQHAAAIADHGRALQQLTAQVRPQPRMQWVNNCVNLSAEVTVLSLYPALTA